MRDEAKFMTETEFNASLTALDFSRLPSFGNVAA